MPAQNARAATPPSPVLLWETVGSIAVLTLNRSAARTRLSEALIAELPAALQPLHDDKSVRGEVIAANCPAFPAGHDMKELTARRSDADRGRAYFATLMNACSAMMQAIVQLPKPVVAAVQGVATAAGCQLVASCDLAVASEAATFATPGVDIGLFCSTPMVALTRNVPRKVAFEMLTTGQFIDAHRAAEVGLVNRVVAADRLGAETSALAATLAGKLTAAVKIGKQAFYDQIGLPLAAAYGHAGQVMVDNMLWRDTEEGIAAFLEKRPPDWA